MAPDIMALVVFSLVIVVVVLCLTVVTLVAIVFGKDQLAVKTLGILEKVSIRLPGLKPSQKNELPKKVGTRGRNQST